MKIAIVGPGLMPIPPNGWGGVEHLVWDMKIALNKLDHDVKIINTNNAYEIINSINQYKPDFVHIQYDDFIELYSYVQYPCAITSHFGYLEQPNRWDYYGARIAKPFQDIKPNVFCLSYGIKEVYQNILNIPSDRLFVTPNGVNINEFNYVSNPKHPDRSIYLAKIDYRKRQHLFQSIKTLWYAGNVADTRFDQSRNYLGEWSKHTLYNNLTHYGNLVLLSDGEAHPLVCMEALAAGIGVVVSQWGAANLDISKDFITVIPEDKINDIEYVESRIIENREYSVQHRDEIREYVKQFDWPTVIKNIYVPTIEKIIAK